MGDRPEAYERPGGASTERPTRSTSGREGVEALDEVGAPGCGFERRAVVDPFAPDEAAPERRNHHGEETVAGRVRDERLAEPGVGLTGQAHRHADRRQDPVLRATADL